MEQQSVTRHAYRNNDKWDVSYGSSDEIKHNDPTHKSPEPWANPSDTSYDNELDNNEELRTVGKPQNL